MVPALKLLEHSRRCELIHNLYKELLQVNADLLKRCKEAEKRSKKIGFDTIRKKRDQIRIQNKARNSIGEKGEKSTKEAVESTNGTLKKNSEKKVLEASKKIEDRRNKFRNAKCATQIIPASKDMDPISRFAGEEKQKPQTTLSQGAVQENNNSETYSEGSLGQNSEFEMEHPKICMKTLPKKSKFSQYQRTKTLPFKEEKKEENTEKNNKSTRGGDEGDGGFFGDQLDFEDSNSEHKSIVQDKNSIENSPLGGKSNVPSPMSLPPKSNFHVEDSEKVQETKNNFHDELDDLFSDEDQNESEDKISQKTPSFNNTNMKALVPEKIEKLEILDRLDKLELKSGEKSQQSKDGDRSERSKLFDSNSSSSKEPEEEKLLSVPKNPFTSKKKSLFTESSAEEPKVLALSIPESETKKSSQTAPKPAGNNQNVSNKRKAFWKKSQQKGSSTQYKKPTPQNQQPLPNKSGNDITAHLKMIKSIKEFYQTVAK